MELYDDTGRLVGITSLPTYFESHLNKGQFRSMGPNRELITYAKLIQYDGTSTLVAVDNNW